MFTFTAQDENDTERLGAALASVLPPGTVVGLVGPLVPARRDSYRLLRPRSGFQRESSPVRLSYS